MSYGKRCRQDKDCSSNICEKTLEGRKCFISDEDDNDENPLNYGKICSKNSDCESNICDRVTIDTKTEFRCIDQPEMYENTKNGNDYCNYNTDCQSGICKRISGLNKRCVAYLQTPDYIEDCSTKTTQEEKMECEKKS